MNYMSCVSKAGIERSVSEREAKPEKDLSRYSGQLFFEYLVVVSLKKSGEVYEPQIAYQFPKVGSYVNLSQRLNQHSACAGRGGSERCY